MADVADRGAEDGSEELSYLVAGQRDQWDWVVVSGWFDAVWVAAIDREEGRSHGARLSIGGFAAVSGNGLAR